jgi:mannose-6-phosphate isomerase-like protein (cupin superfamily)
MADQEFGPIATHLRFENEHVKVWEMDLAPGQMCGLHPHTRDYVLYILEGGRIAVESPGKTSNRFPGKATYELEVGARTISYVPAGGSESARNVGTTRFREAIFEMKRPLFSASDNPGFALTEALAGKHPEPGVMTILLNSRIRAIETTLAPGDETGMRHHEHDAAVFVVEGGQVRVVEKPDQGSEQARDTVLDSSTVLWQPRGAHRNTINVGDTRYREIRVKFR